ncbi:hypothetical protein Q5752_001623 [Cryptotrichosporon argae]
MLKLLVEENEFRDWVEDAKRRLPPMSASPATSHSLAPPETPIAAPPVLSVPDTPVADVEIRLVEPTPVPSRVGSLGGSSGASGLLARAGAQPKLPEEDEEQLHDAPSFEVSSSSSAHGTPASRLRSPRKRLNRFFIQSSGTKHSGSESSQPSPVSILAAVLDLPMATPESGPSRPAVQAVSPRKADPTDASPDRRSSAGSSSAVMMRKKDADGQPAKQRHVSIATMRGRFAGEKARAAEAINKRNGDSKSKDKEIDGEGQGSSDWEDDEDEDEDEGWEDEDFPEKSKGSALRRTSSRSARSANSGLDLTRQISSASGGPSLKKVSLNEKNKAPQPPPAKPMSKKERTAEKARLDAERDAQRKREMFAKQQIFGNQVKQSSEGLLSNIFRSGKSMVDLTQAGQERETPLRRAPTHANLPMLSRSPAPAPVLLRSKSVVAMPVQTGVSVTATVHPKNNSAEKRKPAGIDLETDDDSEDEDENYLASSQVRRKIDELAARRDKRSTPQQQSQPVVVQAVPLSDTVLDANGVVRPLSPTTRRRTMIMREMSESLRRNIILEREKSAGPSTAFGSRGSSTTQQLRKSSSTVSLQQAGVDRSIANQPHRRTTDPLDREAPPYDPHAHLPRGGSHPDLTSHSQQASLANRSQHGPPLSSLRSQHSGEPHAQPQSHGQHPPPHPGLEPTRRRTTHNVLGGGFLRPLTRVGDGASPAQARGGDILGRTQSAVQLSMSPHDAAAPSGLSGSPRQEYGSLAHGYGVVPAGGASASVGQGHSVLAASGPPMLARAPSLLRMEATPMMRSQTEGDERHTERMRLKRELAKRSEMMDTSYRLHGW